MPFAPPDDLDRRYQLANRLIDAGKYEEALQELAGILENSQPILRQETETEVIEPYQARPEQFPQVRRTAEGGKPVRLVIDYFTAACYLHGYCLAALQRYEEALPYLEQANELWPLNNTVRHELSFVYSRLRRFNDALATLQQGIETDPRDAITYKDLAWVYNELGDHQQAVTMAEKAIENDPQLQSAYAELALAYEKVGDVTKAASARAKMH